MTQVSSKGRSIIYILGSVSLLLSFAWGVLNPLYDDEVIYSINLGRFSIDGFRRVSLFPQCTSNFLVPLPRMLWPAAFLSEWIYQLAGSPFQLRMIGTLVGILNCVLLFLLLSIKLRSKPYAFILLAALVSCGVFPALFVFSRPDGVLLLMCLLALAISHYGQTVNSRTIVNRNLGWLIVLAYWFAASLHTFSIFIAPIFISSVCTLKNRNVSKLCMVVGIFLGAQLAYDLHSVFNHCFEDPNLSNLYLNYTSSHRLNVENLRGLVWRVLEDARDFIASLTAIGPLSSYPAGMIFSEGVPGHSFLRVFSCLIAYILLSFFAWILLLGLKTILTKNREFLNPLKWDIQLSAILFSILLLIMVQPNIIPYRFVLILSLVVVAVGDVLFRLQSSDIIPPANKLMRAIGGIGLCSSITTSLLLFPGILINIGKIAIDRQPHSIGIFATSLIQNKVDWVAVEEQCLTRGIEKRIVTDNFTYWQFRESAEMIYFFYLFRTLPATKEDVLDIISRGGVEAIVVACSTARRLESTNIFREVGGICCWNKS